MPAGDFRAGAFFLAGRLRADVFLAAAFFLVARLRAGVFLAAGFFLADFLDVVFFFKRASVGLP